jgi:cyclic 2,3-diphosphoglycerate synthase
MTRALVVIDGEHYAPVVRDAIAELPYDVVGAYFAGGTEKLRGGDEYGVPLVELE